MLNCPHLLRLARRFSWLLWKIFFFLGKSFRGMFLKLSIVLLVILLVGRILDEDLMKAYFNFKEHIFVQIFLGNYWWEEFFSFYPLLLSLWYFRLEAPMHKTPPAWGTWLAYVPLCRLRAWEPILMRRGHCFSFSYNLQVVL